MPSSNTKNFNLSQSHHIYIYNSLLEWKFKTSPYLVLQISIPKDMSSQPENKLNLGMQIKQENVETQQERQLKTERVFCF